MTKQKRFSTEKSIIDAIDRAKGRAMELGIQSDNLEDEAKDNFKKAANPKNTPQDSAHLMTTGREKMKECRKLRKSANNLISGKIPKLGRTLAAFRTETL